MNFVQKIIIAIGLVLAISVVCKGSAMLYKADKDDMSIFDVIFNTKAFKDGVEKKLKEIPRNESEACSFSYIKTFINVSIIHAENVRSCMKVSENDIKRYFEEHDQQQFADDFNNDVNECDPPSSIGKNKESDCVIDAASEYLQLIINNDKVVSENKKLCVHKEIKELYAIGDKLFTAKWNDC